MKRYQNSYKLCLPCAISPRWESNTSSGFYNHYNCNPGSLKYTVNTSVVSKEEKKSCICVKVLLNLKKKRHSFLLKYCTLLCLGETDRIAGKAPVQMSLIRDQFMAILLVLR